MKPRQAEVYVDGYFAGAVDDYDGAFQRLRLDAGPHRIEVRLDGYDPLEFDVRILPGRTVTYRGEMTSDAVRKLRRRFVMARRRPDCGSCWVPVASTSTPARPPRSSRDPSATDLGCATLR